MNSQAMELFMAYLSSNEINPDVIDEERGIIRVGFRLKNTSVSLFMYFEDEDKYAHIEGRNFVNIPSNQIDKIFKICNDLNDSYRWVKFVWDPNANDVCCRCDAVVQLDSCAEEMYELMARMSTIIDEAYPEIMKGLWG
ncbi:MAG: YbjN domain-containing protein [Lachnospiraceae bacterium]|nr:YbjN domain-containing protein [Lachnospiraceae bacterium]